ncbi:MAG: hypothetical protein Q9225_007115 [Loekoesia sp. 1 TL-2023]
MEPATYRLGVDVGGTFTDLLLISEDTGDSWRAKVPSTPEDQSLAVISGKDQILENIKDGADVVLHVVNHGTTVATNTILEQKGAKVGLVVTEGYRDILQTRRSQVPGNLASWITWPKPKPLSPLELTVEAPGRLASDGSEVRAFNRNVFGERLKAIVKQKPDAVTICLINSFSNPAHEEAARQVVKELLPDLSVSISSEVLPELMEYERTITTVVNSYVEPRVRSYLDNLLGSLESKVKHLRILRSDGGLSSVRLASRYPVTWAMSGPAGGVTGAVSVVANQTKYKNLITLDMGGTSTDVALVENAAPHIRRETKIGDLVVKAPSIDVRSVGAGGGSIVRVPDVTKALRVGPESAGSVPGPACYGKGGSVATVTDANAVLGYLPSNLLGGALKLDLHKAKYAVQQVADDLGIDLHEAAEGILKVSNETMYGALRVISVEQGYDPRDFSLVAFGGAGPLHANSLGKLLGAYPVIIPPSPGVLCALGEAKTLLRHEIGKAFTRVLSQTDTNEVLGQFNELLSEIKNVMRDDQGVAEENQTHTFQADLRYSGQANNVPVDVELDTFKEDGLPYLRKLLDAEHQKLFTYTLSSNIEVVNLRVIAEESKVEVPVKRLAEADSPNAPDSLISGRTTMVFDGKEYKECPLWDRSSLLQGHILYGPCVITEMDSNTVIHPGFKAEVDAVANILIWEAGNRPPGITIEPQLDAVMVDVFEHALSNARSEMDTLMTRTTMSPAIREQQDEFNIIAEPSGKMIVGQMGTFIGDFLENWQGNIEPGDIFLTNDPYSVRFGDVLYFDIIGELLERNRRAVASIIQNMPEEPAYFEDWIDDDGQGVGPWKIACTMTKKGEELDFDFSGTDPQAPSSINFYLSIAMFKMFVGIYMLVVYDANVVANDGFHDLLDVTIPEGTLLRPIRPAALSCRTHIIARLMDVLSGLLGQRAPEFMTAAGFSDSPHLMYSGYRENGEWFQLYWIGFGGIPARPIGDGPDGHSLWPAMKAIPNEFLERYYPLRIEQYNTVADSGGAGLYRGGNAQRIHWRFLEEGTISIHDDRWLSKPWGVLGGEPGARSTKTLVRYSQNPDDPPREALGSKQDHIKVSDGDVLEWITWGGGGWGNPYKRDPEVVALEVRRKLVTVEGAKRYGVVLRGDLSLDLYGTKELRGSMDNAQGMESKSEVFNRGGSWKELKARSLEETGLPPPKAPWEITLRGPMTQLHHFKKWQREHQ